MSIKLDLRTIDSAANIQMLKITGNFEEGYVTPLGEEFERFLRGPAVQLILDIQSAKGITGSGITELINARNQIIERGGNVVLIGVGSRIQTMIDLSGLEKYFPVVSTESEALELLKRKTA